jgi:RHS repeat-associated protein
MTDPMNFTSTYVYSPTGKPTGEYGYLDGQWVETAGWSYDSDDRATSYTDGLGHWTTYSYDGVGNRKTVTDANNNTTTYAYDSRNRVTTITDALGHTTVYGYDAAGNPQTVTDALGHTTTTLYDALNRAATITSAVNGTTTITYDAAGRETSLTDPVGNKTQWAYDANDRLTTLTDPLNHTATYVYDGDGELTDTTDRDGRRTTYAYDSDGNRTGETWVGASPSEMVTYTFDADHEMTGAADSFATATIAYDNDGRVGTIATSGPGAGQPTVTLTYSYDQLSDETSVTDSLSSQGVTTYSYDLAQRMTTITTSYGGTAGPQVVYTYDPANRLTTIVRTVGPNFPGVNSNIWYDNANRVATIVDFSHVASTLHSGYVDTPLATYVYGCDNANRVTSELDAEGTATFTYDNANELTAVGGSRTESYSYDLNGNRNSSGYTTGTANELTASPGVTYTYDAEGNLTSQTNTSTHVTTSYTYDYRDRLTNVTIGGTATATYTYDALDRRIGIKDSGTRTWTVYDGTSADALPYADFNSSGSLTQRYLSGVEVVNGALVDEVLARTSSGGTTAWYLPDKLGTVRDIVDSSGNELDHIVYDSFGNITAETNATNGDRFKFAGMEYDATTGQYYDNARWYGSATGRFDIRDPMGFGAGDADLYRYVGNGPTDATDPTGLSGIGGDPNYNAAYRDFILANGGLESQGRHDRPFWGSITFDDLINLADSGAAGVAGGFTGGFTTWFRDRMYGEIASQNHQGIAFSAGQSFGGGLSFGLGFVNPCTLGTSASAGLRALAAIQGAGNAANSYEAFQRGDYSGAVIRGIGAIFNAAQFWKSCFAAGTPLLTPDGSKPIEQFRPGDWVLAAPEDDPEAPAEPRLVEDVFQNYSPLMELAVGGRAIRTTAEHPFWVRGRGWTGAHQLVAGDQLRSHDGRWVTLHGVKGNQAPAPVYNLRVAAYHTYFVGREDWGFSVWAHNARDCLNLIEEAAAAYPKKSGIEWHHYIPLYLGGPKSGRMVELPAAYHQYITNAFRKYWEYGQGEFPNPATLRQIMDKVYRQFPIPPHSQWRPL